MPEVWPVVDDWITRALEGRSLFYRPDDLKQGCLTRHMTLWLGIGSDVHCAAVSRIEGNQNAKVCLVMAAGGVNATEWVHLIHGIEADARTQGCHALEFWGRKGWERMMAPHGYKPAFVAYRRMLDG